MWNYNLEKQDVSDAGHYLSVTHFFLLYISHLCISLGLPLLSIFILSEDLTKDKWIAERVWVNF